MGAKAGSGWSGAPPARRKSFSFQDLRRSLLGYGPFRFAEPFFWLLFASVLRVYVERNPALFVLFFIAQFAVLFAFISATARILERMQGRTMLVDFSFDDTLVVAKSVLRQVAAIVLCCIALLVALSGIGITFDPKTYVSLVVVTDGIAFDSVGLAEKLICAGSALLIFMMIVNAGTGKPVTIAAAIAELGRHGRSMLPAMLLVAVVLIGLSWIQGVFRPLVWETILSRGGAADLPARILFYFFVVGFAVIRLTAVVGICAWFLRSSYMRLK